MVNGHAILNEPVLGSIVIVALVSTARIVRALEHIILVRLAAKKDWEIAIARQQIVFAKSVGGVTKQRKSEPMGRLTSAAKAVLKRNGD